jgi:RNA polymerase subunit RPABC4/transcription elongation factor Spt4
MTPWQNCGKLNEGETNFCRFCGTKFVYQQRVSENPYNYSAPRPYGWKSDEYTTQTEPRPTERMQPGTSPFNPNNFQQPLATTFPQNQYGSLMTPGNYAIDANYHCPRCGSSYMPIIDRRVSTAGWVVFGCLLAFTIIFFWIGLLMKEDVAICPVCRNSIS